MTTLSKVLIARALALPAAAPAAAGGLGPDFATVAKRAATTSEPRNAYAMTERMKSRSMPVRTGSPFARTVTGGKPW
jgi:hypothetical protein